MMKQPFCWFAVFILLLNSFPLTAQQYSISWEDKADKSRVYISRTAITNMSGNILVLKTKDKWSNMQDGWFIDNANITINDADMNEIKTVPLNIEEKFAHNAKIERFGNRLILFYSALDPAKDENSAVALKLNEQTLAVEEKVVMGTLPTENNKMGLYPTTPYFSTEFIYSPDSSKLLAYILHPENNKTNKRFMLAVYNNQLQKEWSSNIELPVSERKSSIYDVALSNDGRALVSVKEYEGYITRFDVKEDSKTSAYNTFLYVFDNTGTQVGKIQLNKDNFLKDSEISFENGNNIYLAGLYKAKHNGNIKGISLHEIDIKSVRVINNTLTPFPDELIKQVDVDDFASTKESDAGLSKRFSIGHIFKRPDGTIDLISEYVHADREIVGVNNNSKLKIYYTYGDIINARFSAGRKPVFTRIPKRQEDINQSLYLGYFPFLYKDKLLLIYNDNRNNLKQELTAKPDRALYYFRSVLTVASIDSDGKLSREVIYDHNDGEYIIAPRLGTRIADNKIQVEALRYRLMSGRSKVAVIEIK